MGMAAASDNWHGPIPPDPEPEHNFYRTRFTGNTICEDCGLLPLDDEDVWSDCPFPYPPCVECGLRDVHGEGCTKEEVNDETDRTEDV
jgi:hypothetical protein